MKARNYLALSLLLATSCCITSSLFCADSAKPRIPNHKERERLELTCKELEAKKNPTLEELETKASYYQQLRQAHEQLSQLPNDQHKEWRAQRIQDWTEKGKNARYELLTHKIELFKKANTVNEEKLQTPNLSDEDKVTYLKEKHIIIHNLKLLAQERIELYPSDVEAQKNAVDLTQQSMIFGMYEELLAQKSTAATQSHASPVAMQQTAIMTTHTQPVTTTTSTSNTISTPTTPNAADPDVATPKDSEKTSENTTQKTGKNVFDNCSIQ